MKKSRMLVPSFTLTSLSELASSRLEVDKGGIELNPFWSVGVPYLCFEFPMTLLSPARIY